MIGLYSALFTVIHYANLSSDPEGGGGGRGGVLITVHNTDYTNRYTQVRHRKRSLL